MPALAITEAGGRVRLNLGGFAHGEGSSLQEAADQLIRQLLELALAFRSSGCSASRRLRPDLETMHSCRSSVRSPRPAATSARGFSPSPYCLAIATRRSSS